VGLELSIRFHPIKPELPVLHSTIGPAYYDKIVKPSLRSEARKVVGQYTPEEIYSSKRLEVADGVKDVMIQAIQGKHIVIETVLLRDVALPAKLKVAIEAKLEEEQAALKMKFVLDREGREAERKRIEAQGIADFQRIVAKGISPLLLQWKGIEATEKLAASPNAKVVVIGSGDDGLPLILGGQN
jgi:regulator of protease activity HflC (stomatin/prohibitin superfamily)